MKKYLVYLRRSTSDENHQQYSLDAQEKICMRYVQQKGLTIARIIREEHSAKLAGKRPKFLQMLDELRQGKFAGIVVHNVDRLLRSIGDYALIDTLRTTGTEFHFVDGSYPDTPEGNMMLGINVVFAKWYVEKLGKEVKKGFRESLEQGRLPREAPVGYLDKGRGIKEPDPIYAPLVQQAFELYATGDYSLESLTTEMLRRGLKTKRGQRYAKNLSKSSMHRILSNPFYCGKVIMKDIEYQGGHTPIISHHLFAEVNRLLSGKNTSMVSRKPFAYRGLLHCSCGQLLSPYQKKGRTYYGCHNRKCSQSTTREETIDEQISKALDQLVFTKEELLHTREAMNRLEQLVSSERDSGFYSISERRKKILSRLDKVRQLVIDGTFEKDDYEHEKESASKELASLVEEEERIQHLEIKRLSDVYEFLELSRSASLYYMQGTHEEKRRIVQMVFLDVCINDKQLSSHSLKDAFIPLENRHLVSSGGADGTRTRDLLRDRQTL